MANEYVVNRDDLLAVANAIRSKAGTEESLTFPNGFTDKINSIEVGGGDSEADAIIDGLIDGTLTELYNDRVTSVAAYKFQRNQIISVSLPNVTTLGAMAFAKCSNLVTIDMPLLSTVGSQVFQDCDSLKEVSLPNLSGSIAYSFSNCDSLNKVSLPNVSDIGYSTFQNCSSLTTLILGENCTLSSTGALKNTPIANGTGYIYFPDDVVEQKKSETNWSTYANQIKGISALDGSGQVTFRVYNSEFDNLDFTYTVDEGTTWGEWAETTYNDDLGYAEYQESDGGILFVDWSMYIFDSNNTKVNPNSEIVAGDYELN